MSERSGVFRGNLMRRMARIQAQIDLLIRSEKRDNRSQEKRRELEQKLVALKLKM
jgi:hypothetical protein